jgi:hypothetical protein
VKESEITAGDNEDAVMSVGLNQFILFPNPTSGNFTVMQKTGQPAAQYRVEIFGLNGERMLAESVVGGKRHEFVTSNFPAGLYFIRIISNDQIETFKLVKTN